MAKYNHHLFAANDIDAFNFTTTIPIKLTERKWKFYVEYQMAGEEFWDNNKGQNYIVNVALEPSSSTFPFFSQQYGTVPLDCVPRGSSTRRQQKCRWRRGAVDESNEEKETVYVPPSEFPHF